MRHRHSVVEHPKPVSIDSKLAEPMRLALKGQSGTIIGLDYRGETVMAAYEPVPTLGLGIVAKIDLSEVRAPFVKSLFVSTSFAIVVVLIGTILFFWISNPLIKRLEEYSQNLEKHIEIRKQAQIKLDEKNKELEQIIYVASHDLRSPIVNIAGYSRELSRVIDDIRSAFDSDKTPAQAYETVTPMLTQDIPEALHFITSSVTKMDSLLTGLLKLSRSGRASLTIESLDMNKLMTEVTDSSEFQIKKVGVEIDVDDLPPCQGDEVQVNQIFSNLLNNPLQFLDPERPGIIRISGKVEGDKCVYCVEDNGIGIAAEHQQKIFDIFQQLDPVNSEGDGLGLAIIQQILGRLSGDIRVESHPGKGSRFYVGLPADTTQ